MDWWIAFVVCQLFWASAQSWGSDKVLLRDLSAITLHQGQMTTGRRSSPVPQLKCIGGSAGCGSFVPQTVQCRNVGFDGHDVQWECKTDMDDSYRFGKIQVTCEGYDYPDDPYVLKGSCGLEYTIDSTEAGKARNNNYGGGYNHSPSWKNSQDSSGGWFVFVIIVFAVVFLICKMGTNNTGSATHSRHRPDPRHHAHRPYPGGNPPPPGFKPEYTHPDGQYEPPPSYSDATNTAHHSTSSTYTHAGSAAPNAGGGFWSGLGLGGLAGYLFGSRRNYGYRRHSPGWGYGGWNNWGNSGWGNSWGGGNSWGRGGSSWSSGSTTYRGSSRSSSGTSRTASGFGGTSRR